MTCRRCKWHDNEYGINCTGFFGNKDADIVLVGEAFGKEEAKSGEAFVGKAGLILNELLSLAGLKRSEVAVMNAMRCYQSGNPTPTHKELNLCFPFTQRDIKKINPKLVVALGGCALYSLTGKEVLEPYLGRLIYSDKIKRKVYVVNHPAACLYSKGKWETLREHFKKIPEMIELEPQEVKHYPYIHITTKDEFYNIIDNLYEAEELFLDSEETGLDPYSDTIELLQLGVSENEIYVIERDVLLEVKKTLKDLLENKSIIGAGFEHDHKFVNTNLNIDFKNYGHDVVLSEYIISGMKDNDLHYLTRKYVPESFGYDDEVIKAGGFHKTKDDEIARQYAADDVGVMPKIRKKQYKQMVKDDTIWLYENITLPCNRILTEMSLRGVMVNVDKIKEVDRVYEKRAEKLLNRIVVEDPGIEKCEKHFKRKFNPRSSEMVKWLLLDYYKLPVINTTKKDNPSVGQTEMEKYAEQYNNSYCKIMEKYRSYQTLRDNFLSGLIPKLVDGIAHTTYSLHATGSSRPNSKNPNLLNLPNIEDIKRCFIARPGNVFLYSDESQIEVRVAAVIFDDQNLIDIVNSGKDFHSMVTSRVYNVSYETVFDEEKGDVRPEWKDRRRICKTITFGILYQEGPTKLAYNLGIEFDEAKKFISNYYKGFPDLKKNIKKTIDFVIEKGYVDTYFGFRRRWKYHTTEDHSTHREAVNHPIQGSAWQLLQLCLIQIDEYLKKKYGSSFPALVMQVYDSIVVEVQEDLVEEIAPVMKEIMENVNKPYKNLNRVKLKADIEVGYNLEDLKGVDL